MSTAKDTVGTFLNGQKDCQDGEPCRSQDPDYIRGYEYQYWCEESRTGMQIQRERDNETRRSTNH